MKESIKSTIMNLPKTEAKKKICDNQNFSKKSPSNLSIHSKSSQSSRPPSPVQSTNISDNSKHPIIRKPSLPTTVTAKIQPKRASADTARLQRSLNDFRMIGMVGKGGFAKVYKVMDLKDCNKILAMKVMRKDHIRKMKQVNNVLNEKRIQKEASNNNFIVKIIETFQDPVHLFIIQEFLDGGDLFNYIKSNGHFKDKDAKFYACEIFLGLSYLHNLTIVYRDLKPENVLFGSDGHLKLADLGFAKKLNGKKTKSFCGTPSYLAPEVLERNEYGLEVDWWTFGVLIFQLCSGCSPFQEGHPNKTFSRILNCAIRWPPEPQNYFTEVVFDMIMGLFELDPQQRMTEGDIKTHEWFADIDFDAMEKRKIDPPSKFLNMVGGTIEKTQNVELSAGEHKESTDALFIEF